MRRALRRPVAGDLSGAIADLGIFVPLVAALILVNGLHPGPLLLIAGLLSLLSGLWFRIPFPVQPLKALTALAVAQQLGPEVIRAAGLLIGLILIVLTLTGLADRVARIFTRPVIRALQLAVGVLLVVTAVRLAIAPPDIFEIAPPPATALTLMLLTVGVVALAVWRRWYSAATTLVVLGAALQGAQTWGIPDGFDVDGFLAASKKNFVSLQKAWDSADINALRTMMTDDMLSEIKGQLAEREQQGGAATQTEVVMLEAQLLGIEEFEHEYMASVEFSGMMSEDPFAGPTAFREVWNITKPKASGGWRVAGLQAMQ